MCWGISLGCVVVKIVDVCTYLHHCDIREVIFCGSRSVRSDGAVYVRDKNARPVVGLPKPISASRAVTTRRTE